MPSLAYGRSAYRRDTGGLPEIRLVNMFVEASEASEQQVTLQSRPGLIAANDIGSGPIQAILKRSGTLGGETITVSGGAVYRGADLLGSVPINGPVSIAAAASSIAIAAGAGLAYSSGTTVSLAAFPDGADVAAVAYIGGLFVSVRKGTHRFYWSAVNDPSSWDALDYASAESSPDPLVDAIVVGDLLYLVGVQTIEVWAITGALDLPFSRIEARDYQRGAVASGCAAGLDNTLVWVGDDCIVYRAGSIPERLSDHGIEERIRASASVSAFTIAHDGHKFFAVRLDTATLLLDVATRQWSEFASYGRANWRVQCAEEVAGTSILGDDETGTLWSLNNAAFDDDGRPLERLFTAVAPTKGQAIDIANLQLDCDFGRTPLLTGLGADPQVEVRASRDLGRNWEAWQATSLGQQGQYRSQPSWRRFGMFDVIAAMFEIRVTDPAPFRVSAVKGNEFGGGRSR